MSPDEEVGGGGIFVDENCACALEDSMMDGLWWRMRFKWKDVVSAPPGAGR